MALQPQDINFNFAKGLDTKSDPKQLSIGTFLSMVNSIFTETGLWKKRNGYGSLVPLPDSSATYLTTFGGNLTAIGNKIEAFAQGAQQWINKGAFQPLLLSVQPIARSAFNQTQCDSIIAPNGLMCTVYTEINNNVAAYKYVIQDSVTGQNIIAPTLIPASGGTLTGSPRVFLLGVYFVIVFTNQIGGSYHLQYIAVSSNTPTVVIPNADIAANYIPASTVSWDGVVVGKNLYIAYNTMAGGQQVAVTYLSQGFILAAPQSFTGSVATVMSVCADLTTPSAPIIYASFWDSGSSTGFAVAVDQNLNQVMTATEWLATGNIVNVASAAQNGIVTIIYENSNAYSYDSGVPSNFLSQNTITKPATVIPGTLGSASIVLRSVGLASKAFMLNAKIYILTAYQSALQSVYFMIDLNGNAVARFAYENGGGYLPTGLPQAQVIGQNVTIAYLFKDLIESLNTTGLVQSVGPAGASNIYTQTGVNLASMVFGSQNLVTAEIGNNLNLTGGFLYNYDGNTLSEQLFHVFPDNVEAVWSASGGSVAAQPDSLTNTDAYYYQVLYRQMDAQGNLFNGAPSVPIAVTTTGTGTSGSITLNGPMLRVTYKSNVTVEIYRWSVENEVYQKITSVTAPLLNSTTADSWTFVDTFSDAQILGNETIYTTGGVLENIPGPAARAIALFDTRLWAINAEDGNLWFSKPVIPGTPVEMSDFETEFVAPTTGSSGSTGQSQCIFPMDDKLIIFNRGPSAGGALYYINGLGPDITGANNGYSQPIFINSTVSCVNQSSIVFSPMGLMFQAAGGRGIYLLTRDLQEKYIGAEVEAFNQFTVNSATNIPNSTQIKFTLSNGTILMYDYFQGQWDTDQGAPSISSTIYQNLHTVITSRGTIGQETPGAYLDFGNPVNMSCTTGWLNLASLQGNQRAYFFYLLGQYITPHKLKVDIAYDFNSAIQQSTIIGPTNFANVYGGLSPYGQDNPYGGPGDGEQWRVFLSIQQCQSIQISLTEIYDATFGVQAGAGFTMSGIKLVYGVKKGWRPMSAAQSTGGQQ